MKIEIDTNDIIAFIATFSTDVEEWYDKENKMTLNCIIDLLQYNGNVDAVKELEKVYNTL